MPAINMTSKYRTKDGRAVRILAVDLKYRDPVAAAVAETCGEETVMLYCADGSYWNDEPCDADLVEVVEVVRFVPVYLSGQVGGEYTTLEVAREGRATNVVGILKVTVTDGVPSVEMVETFPQR